MKISEMVKRLKKAGCYIVRAGTNHDIWYSPVTDKYFIVARHPSKELKSGTANSIMRDAGLK